MTIEQKRVVQGHLTEAEIVYSTLVEKNSEGVLGSQYTDLATIFLNSYHKSGDMGAACVVSAEFAAINDNLILSPLRSDFYGSFIRDYSPDDICSFK